MRVDGSTGSMRNAPDVAADGAAFLASAGQPPRHAFGTQQAAEDHIRRTLLDMQNGLPRGENGDFATIFQDRSSGLFYVYGPDQVGNYGSDGSIPGMRAGLESHLDRAVADLGQDVRYVSGGIILNSWFHLLRPNADGYLHPGEPQ